MDRLDRAQVFVLAAALETLSEYVDGNVIDARITTDGMEVQVLSDVFRQWFSRYYLRPRSSATYPYEAIAIVGRTRFIALILTAEAAEWQANAQPELPQEATA